MAPKVGLEPTTNRLTAGCSTTELLRNNVLNVIDFSYYSDLIYNRQPSFGEFPQTFIILLLLIRRNTCHIYICWYLNEFSVYIIVRILYIHIHVILCFAFFLSLPS